MNNAIYKIEFNDTVVTLICILVVYYIAIPLIKRLITLIKEDKEEVNINV